LIRLRFNTKAHETPGGELKWRVIFEKDGTFEEVLVKDWRSRHATTTRTTTLPSLRKLRRTQPLKLISLAANLSSNRPSNNGVPEITATKHCCVLASVG
jgi:hypothetical protein